MIPKKTTKMIVKDGSGNLVQLLPEIETASTIDASSDVPVSNAALASALEDIEESLPASALLDVMEEEPTALNTTELDDEALIVWMPPQVPSWSITINTELDNINAMSIDGSSYQARRTGQIPFCLYGIENASMDIDWGDGIIQHVTDDDAEQWKCLRHTYETSGIYTIVMTSNDFNRLHMYTFDGSQDWGPAIYSRTLISINSALPTLAGVHTVDNIYDEYIHNIDNSCHLCFWSCINLSNIPSNLFENNISSTDFSWCFYECSSLQSIPAGIFAKNTAATSFEGCFENCTSLQSIPAGLFDSNTAASNFAFCFNVCSSLQSIPAGLFDKNTAVTTFYLCFDSCSSLQSIPSNLFVSNTAVTNFEYCFCNCSSLNDFILHIGSSSVSNCTDFVTNKSSITRTVYVPSGSTTQTSFNNVASSLGLTIIGE